MPLYEYLCDACGARFEALVMGENRPACTTCGGVRLQKLMSTFAVSAGATGAPPRAMDSGCGTCGDPRGPGSCRSDG